MKVLVCGGRDFDDVDLMYGVLDALDINHVVSGHARGADQMAEMWADQRGIPLSIFPAEWEVHGRRAGPIRNQQMLDEGKPDLVIAFPGGRGTADMVARAKKAGVMVREISLAP